MREAFKPNGILATLRIVHHSQVLQHGLRTVGHSKASVGVKGKDVIHGGVDSTVGDVGDNEYNGEEAEGEGEGEESEGANTLASAMEQAMGECGQVPPFDEFQIYTDAWWGEAATPFYVSLDVWWWSELVGLCAHLQNVSCHMLIFTYFIDAVGCMDSVRMLSALPRLLRTPTTRSSPY